MFNNYVIANLLPSDCASACRYLKLQNLVVYFLWTSRYMVQVRHLSLYTTIIHVPSSRVFGASGRNKN